jgi:hypothetical protein
MVAVLAFSLQQQIEKYGAYVAVASFLGLALLSILYFAQAREVRRLRDWAGRAPERDAELEARVVERADAVRDVEEAEPVAAPADATRVIAPPVPAAGGLGLEPVGNGRPGSPPVAVPMGPRPAVAAALVAAAIEAAAAPVAPATASPEDGEATPADDTPGPVSPPTVAPVPAAMPTSVGQETVEHDAIEPVGNGHGTPEESERAVSAAERPVEIPRATPRPAAAAAGAPAARRPAQPVRAAERSATVPPRRTTPPARRGRPEPEPARHGHGRGVLIGIVAGVLVLAAAALAITQLGDGGDSPPAPNTTEPAATSTAAAGTGSTGAPSKAETTVVILNGTSTDGLAGRAKDQLLAAGYSEDRLPTSNAANSATAQSTVYYASGRRETGLSVARTLDINAVEPVTPDIQTLANNSSDPPVEADVVVVLGADRTP